MSEILVKEVVFFSNLPSNGDCHTRTMYNIPNKVKTENGATINKAGSMNYKDK